MNVGVSVGVLDIPVRSSDVVIVLRHFFKTTVNSVIRVVVGYSCKIRETGTEPPEIGALSS
jgi:hypothetical protein